MRLVCISDTHNEHGRLSLPPGDVLIHAGDMTEGGTARELARFNTWLGGLPFAEKIVIAGNHEVTTWDRRSQQVLASFLVGATYLCDEAAVVNGLSVYGAPWVPSIIRSRAELEALRERWEEIPTDTDVLVVHGPPYGTLDRNGQGEWIGDPALRDRIRALHPRLVVFGHVHASYGLAQLGETTYVNASMLRDDSRRLNAPIVIDLD